MECEKVAVIILNYNGFDDTCELIANLSLIKHKIGIIIVDNNSPNNDGERLQKKFPHLHVILNNENSGFAAGTNLGIKLALDMGYEYVMPLGNDTIIDENLIDELLEYSNNNAISMPTFYYYDDPKIIQCAGGEINRYLGNRTHIHMGKYDDGKYTSGIRKCTYANGCCMMIHKDIINKVGLFDEDYFMYYEDTAYGLKLLQNEIDIIHVGPAKVFHKECRSSGGHGISGFRIYYLIRNKLNMIKSHTEYFKFTAYIVSLIVGLLKICFYRIRGIAEWRAFYNGIRDHLNGKTGKTVEYILTID